MNINEEYMSIVSNVIKSHLKLDENDKNPIKFTELLFFLSENLEARLLADSIVVAEKLASHHDDGVIEEIVEDFNSNKVEIGGFIWSKYQDWKNK